MGTADAQVVPMGCVAMKPKRWPIAIGLLQLFVVVGFTQNGPHVTCHGPQLRDY
jgi:hypothetical protein